ncbi:MAG: NCS2 family permease, partial [Oscillospiraceae bacterium]|nr:NCS2 family permease [Oscillospiraceae bacterium]
MEQLFQLKRNGTSVRTEVVAGLTTFMTMAYIIALNPNLLTNFAVGTPLWNGVFLATCIASAIGTACMAFLANKPFVMAPGMGLNSFFAVIAGNIAAMTGKDYTNAFQAALCIILVEGIVFILLSVMNIRDKIVTAIPLGVRLGIGPSIGLMLMNIGLGSNVGIYAEGNGYSSPFYVMRDFFGAMTPRVLKEGMGAEYTQMVLTVVTMFLGLFVIILLAKRGIKAAVLLGMLAASVIYWIGEALVLHVNPFASLAGASFVPPLGDMVATTLFKFNFAGFFELGWFTAITLIITFCMIDMFDTIGTLVGTASRAGMTDREGNMPKMKQALLSDAVGTVAGACTGTSTVTTFVESASGVEAGGRTGLTALVAAVMFLACMFIAPIAAIIPAAATSAALIYVGILMLQGLHNVDFEDVDQIVPVFLMLLAMPISGSIGHGIGIAMICFTVIKVFSG